MKISVQPQPEKRKRSGPASEGSLLADCQELPIIPWKKPALKHPSKRPKPSVDGKQVFYQFVPWKLNTSLEDVQKSYRRAKDTGDLRSSFVPQLESKSVDHARTKRWDPYILQKEGLNFAQLDEGKLENVQKQLKRVIRRVPKATQ